MAPPGPRLETADGRPARDEAKLDLPENITEEAPTAPAAPGRPGDDLEPRLVLPPMLLPVESRGDDLLGCAAPAPTTGPVAAVRRCTPPGDPAEGGGPPTRVGDVRGPRAPTGDFVGEPVEPRFEAGEPPDCKAPAEAHAAGAATPQTSTYLVAVTAQRCKCSAVISPSNSPPFNACNSWRAEMTLSAGKRPASTA
mmetsp:Transcript_828/g.2613  ORF Transcript_828/g.2613 Transcript_828/m.2613 type:complete len:196 (+) Transcript_828:814-1401(+)